MIYHVLALCCLVFNLFGQTPQLAIQEDTPTRMHVSVAFDLSSDERVYQDSLTCAVDHPDMLIQDWNIQEPVYQEYDQQLKETKSVIKNHMTINASIAIKEPYTVSITPHMQISFLTNTMPQAHQFSIALPHTIKVPVADIQTNAINAIPEVPHCKTGSTAKPWCLASILARWATTIGNLVTDTRSLPLKLLFVFLLGILMSLTPCIYPMIPITVGILQAHHKKSIWGNLCIGLSYTAGLSTTFACLGLLAAYSGLVFGRVLASPFFVLILVLFLGYLALSMLGLYNLYIPRFTQMSVTKSTGNSYLTAFFFGAASGTIASPCVSPGLALLLSIVATTGNVLYGFVMLFIFGLGLSTPLLIIGTSSNLVSFLPQAGMWMIEIKKIFGFLLLGVCLYYLRTILPNAIILGLLSIGSIAAGIYYLYRIMHRHSAMYKLRMLFGIILLAMGIIAGARVIQEHYFAPLTQTDQFWSTDYKAALQQARIENKKLFIDCWASFCSICICINNTTLADSAVKTALQQHYIPLKADGSIATDEPFHSINQKFNVTQFPTFLIIDPTTENIVARFGGEIYNMCISDVVQLLETNQ